MKKIILTLVIMAGCMSAQAQGLFFRVGGGFNLPMGSQVLGADKTTVTTTANSSSTTTVTEENVYGSLGQSINFGLRVGYMFTENFGADLGVNYHLGSSIEIVEKETSNFRNSEADLTTTVKTSANSLIFTPSFIIAGSQEKMFSPYVRAGLAIGLPSAVNTVTSNGFRTVPFGGRIDVNTEMESETTFGAAFGLTGGVGLDVHFGEMFGLYGEINFLTMSIKATETEITKATSDGKDVLADIKPEDRIMKFEDKTTKVTSSFSTDTDNVSLATLQPYSFVGINVGLKIRF